MAYTSCVIRKETVLNQKQLCGWMRPSELSCHWLKLSQEGSKVPNHRTTKYPFRFQNPICPEWNEWMNPNMTSSHFPLYGSLFRRDIRVIPSYRSKYCSRRHSFQYQSTLPNHIAVKDVDVMAYVWFQTRCLLIKIMPRSYFQSCYHGLATTCDCFNKQVNALLVSVALCLSKEPRAPNQGIPKALSCLKPVCCQKISCLISWGSRKILY